MLAPERYRIVNGVTYDRNESKLWHLLFAVVDNVRDGVILATVHSSAPNGTPLYGPRIVLRNYDKPNRDSVAAGYRITFRAMQSGTMVVDGETLAVYDCGTRAKVAKIERKPENQGDKSGNDIPKH